MNEPFDPGISKEGLNASATRNGEELGNPAAMKHALTVDVEDYFHVSAFADVIRREQWHEHRLRVDTNTRKLLDLFDSRATKATFFVLGWVTERLPELVREIHQRGHEVACHGYSHQLVFRQQTGEFHDETIRAKAMLEDAIGQRVRGYRAASYSVTRESLWALDILMEAGFDYDSSIFPVHHDRYGIPDAPRRIHRARRPGGGEIIEFPLTSAPLFKWRLPVAGGGYFRLYPYAFSRHFLQRAVDELKHPFIFYLHPWEVDVDQPRVPGASLLSRFRHYNNLARCEPRLRRLLHDFSFAPVVDVLEEHLAQEPLEDYLYA
jgi:polysaccharide deacetylase family protein (PEP-CTERM system associated)